MTSAIRLMTLKFDGLCTAICSTVQDAVKCRIWNNVTME